MISKGNLVKFARFMLLGISEQAKTGLPFLFFVFFHSMYNKTIFRYGLCDIQNNQGFGDNYQLQPSVSADKPYLDLDCSGYHKNLIQ